MNRAETALLFLSQPQKSGGATSTTFLWSQASHKPSWLQGEEQGPHCSVGEVSGSPWGLGEIAWAISERRICHRVGRGAWWWGGCLGAGKVPLKFFSQFVPKRHHHHYHENLLKKQRYHQYFTCSCPSRGANLYPGAPFLVPAILLLSVSPQGARQQACPPTLTVPSPRLPVPTRLEDACVVGSSAILSFLTLILSTFTELHLCGWLHAEDSAGVPVFVPRTTAQQEVTF